MSNDYFRRVQSLTPTRFWINNVTRAQARQAIEAGACGCTQNPAYTWKMISTKDEAEREYVLRILDDILARESDDSKALVALQRQLIGKVAEIFHPIYEASHGKFGYVSIQGDPLHEDADTIIESAHYNRQAGDNLMCKIPVTEEGLKAIRVLAGEGVPINATEVMSVRQALDVCEVYREATRSLEHPAPIYYSHITGIFDEYLHGYVEREAIDVDRDVLWQAGIVAAKKTYALTKSGYPEVGFIGGGARGLQHFTEMVGADAVVTINWAGTADRLIERDGPVLEEFLRPTPDYVIDEMLQKVPEFRRGFMIDGIRPEEYEDYGPVVLFRSSFEDAWKNALRFIADRR